MREEHDREPGRERQRLPLEPRRHRLRRHRHRERDRHEERHAEAKPRRVDADRPAPGLEHALEELGQMPHVHDPEGERGEQHPEAVEKDGAEGERDGEREDVERSEIAAEANHRDDDHARSGEDVHGLPDLHLADADEHLRVDRLRQRVVELPVANLLGETHHVRLDDGADDAAHDDLDAEHHEQLVLRPAVELRRVRVDEREDDEPGDEREQRLEHLEREVHAVLEVVHHPHAQVQQRDAQRRHQLPTAV